MHEVWLYFIETIKTPVLFWVFAIHAYPLIFFLYWLNRNRILLFANLVIIIPINIYLYIWTCY